MVLVFRFFKKTVAPTTGSELSPSTVPDTVRTPMLWPKAAGANIALRGPAASAPSATKLHTITASQLARLNLLLLFLFKGLVFLVEVIFNARQFQRFDADHLVLGPAFFAGDHVPFFHFVHFNIQTCFALRAARHVGLLALHSISYYGITDSCSTPSLVLGRTLPQVKGA